MKSDLATKRWLSTGEAAQLTGPSAVTLWRYIRRGLIPDRFLLRVGTHTKIDRAWVQGTAS